MEAQPAFYPRITVRVFLSLAAVAGLLGVTLFLLRQPPWIWCTAGLALVLALANARSVVRRKDSEDVRRAEARLHRLFTPPRNNRTNTSTQRMCISFCFRACTITKSLNPSTPCEISEPSTENTKKR